MLTQTSAGVAALRGRLGKAGVPARSYRIATNDGWVMRMISLYPEAVGHNPGIVTNPDYRRIRETVSMITESGPLFFAQKGVRLNLAACER